jgi:pimeloyl-ACP methyl ester carboxylesterase
VTRHNLIDIADLNAEFIDVIAASPVIVFGHSFGGHVALVLADRHPRLVRQVIVGGSPLDMAYLKKHVQRSEKMLRHWT